MHVLDSKAQLAVVLACFNRRTLTLNALTALQSSAERAGVQALPIVVDDASTDGTPQAVRQRFPQARVIETGGDLFWCRSMHKGIEAAMMLQASHLLWLNDDTLLHVDALSRLLQEQENLSARLGAPTIVVGATTDGKGTLTYGGRRLTGSPLRGASYQLVGGGKEPVACDAMDGNCVLVPMSVARQLGNIDASFEHAMGDTDYALRARAAGVPLYVASGFVGECANNPVAGGFTDRSLSLSQRWRAVMHRKGLPWRSWLHFSRRHGGLMWPFYFAWPYVRVVVSSAWPAR